MNVGYLRVTTFAHLLFSSETYSNRNLISITSPSGWLLESGNGIYTSQTIPPFPSGFTHPLRKRDFSPLNLHSVRLQLLFFNLIYNAPSSFFLILPPLLPPFLSLLSCVIETLRLYACAVVRGRDVMDLIAACCAILMIGYLPEHRSKRRESPGKCNQANGCLLRAISVCFLRRVCWMEAVE